MENNVKFKTIIKFTLIILVIVSLALVGVQKLFPVLNCGNSTYYQFRDIEGPYYTMNIKNSQFRFNPLPSLIWTERQFDYPLVATIGDIQPKSDPHYFIAKTSDFFDNDIENLKKCFPMLKITPITFDDTIIKSVIRTRN
jgi:hypothetical protein